MIHIGRWRGSAAAAAGGQAALHQVVVRRRRGLCHLQIKTRKRRRLPAFFSSQVCALLPPGAAPSHLFAFFFFLPLGFFPSFHALFRLLAPVLVTSRALLSAPHDAFSACRAATWDPALSEKLRNRSVLVFFSPLCKSLDSLDIIPRVRPLESSGLTSTTQLCTSLKVEGYANNKYNNWYSKIELVQTSILLLKLPSSFSVTNIGDIITVPGLFSVFISLVTSGWLYSDQLIVFQNRVSLLSR